MLYRMYEIQGHYVRSGPREKSSRLYKLRTDLKECEIIHQPTNDENFTLLINAGPRLNAGVTAFWASPFPNP